MHLLASTALLSIGETKASLSATSYSLPGPAGCFWWDLRAKCFIPDLEGDMVRLSTHTRLFALLCCLVLATVTWFIFSRTAAHAATGFTPQARLGFPAGDDWEPAMAADRYGHVYVLYKHYDVAGQTSCTSCALHVLLQISNDRGQTWSAPRPIDPELVVGGQYDSQIVVDPVDGKTIWASFLQNSKSSIVVMKSTDFGQTWLGPAIVDKDELAVRGSTIAVAYNAAQKIYASISYDGGQTWSLMPVGVSGGPYPCASCGFAFLGAQMTMAIGSDDSVYLLYNATVDQTDYTPERIYFVKSSDHGANYSARQNVSLAAQGVEHCFPAITTGAGSGDVRIAWTDTRTGSWNLFYRSSNDGGAAWSGETRVSSYVPGFSYITPTGFGLPYGDYFQMAVDDRGSTQLAWGEAGSYAGPGNIWAAHT
jgi:hypothetical protein